MSERLSTTPIEAMLGTGAVECKVFAGDVSVHWWPTGAKPGDACLCGATTMAGEAA